VNTNWRRGCQSSRRRRLGAHQHHDHNQQVTEPKRKVCLCLALIVGRLCGFACSRLSRAPASRSTRFAHYQPTVGCVVAAGPLTTCQTTPLALLLLARGLWPGRLLPPRPSIDVVSRLDSQREWAAVMLHFISDNSLCQCGAVIKKYSWGFATIFPRGALAVPLACLGPITDTGASCQAIVTTPVSPRPLMPQLRGSPGRRLPRGGGCSPPSDP
jgi:hypothetical protein